MERALPARTRWRVIGDPDHPGLAEHAVHDAVGRGHRRRMGDRRLPARFRGPALQQDDGLPAGDLPGHLQKAVRPLEALDVDQDSGRLRVLTQVFQRVRLIDVDLVPQPHHPGDAEMLAGQDILQGVGAEIPRLGDVGDPAAADLPLGEEGGGEPHGRRGMTRRVRAQGMEPPLPDERFELPLDPGSRLVDLGKAAGGEDEMADPLIGAFAHRLGRGRRGQDDHRHIDVPRQACDGGADIDSQDLAPLGIDRIQFPGIPVRQDVHDHVIAGLAGDGGGADDGHASGLKKRYQFISHHFSPSANRLREESRNHGRTAACFWSATRASTATGAPSGRILIGFMSISRTWPHSQPIFPRATMIRASASRSTAG